MIHDFLCRMYNAFTATKFYKGLSGIFLGDIEYRITRSIQFQLSVFSQHQKIFTQYRNANVGKDIVIVACGPTAKSFTPIKNAVYIGLNRAIRLDTIKFDFWFMQDFGNSTPQEREDYIAYKGNNCVKFFGVSNFSDLRNGHDHHNPSELDIVRANGLKYYHDYNSAMNLWRSEFTYDISVSPLSNFGSVVFPALQFALWTNPRRIFLVGCDCTATGHFYSDGDKTGLPPNNVIRKSYEDFKDFAHCHYPETEIISVNPVGLRGVFRDWDQSNGPLE